jgi:hypothetical protein
MATHVAFFTSFERAALPSLVMSLFCGVLLTDAAYPGFQGNLGFDISVLSHLDLAALCSAIPQMLVCLFVCSLSLIFSPCCCHVGFSWKGQSSPITKLLQLLVLQAPDPSQCLLEVITATLKEAPGKVATKQQLEPVAGYAALCSATFLAWYK